MHVLVYCATIGRVYYSGHSIATYKVNLPMTALSTEAKVTISSLLWPRRDSGLPASGINYIKFPVEKSPLEIQVVHKTPLQKFNKFGAPCFAHPCMGHHGSSFNSLPMASPQFCKERENSGAHLQLWQSQVENEHYSTECAWASYISRMLY